jgi:hypothetical protein
MARFPSDTAHYVRIFGIIDYPSRIEGLVVSVRHA